jgi:hypothetical protein
VEEAQADESKRGLMPPRIETDEPGIAGEFERAHSSTGWQKAENRHDSEGEPCEIWADRESRRIGRDWVFEEHVQHRVIPRDFGVG